jgi:hypothetical protein
VSVLHPSPLFIVLVLQLAPTAVVLKPKSNELNLKLLLFVLFINVYIYFSCYYSLIFAFCLYVCVFSFLLVFAL